MHTEDRYSVTGIDAKHRKSSKVLKRNFHEHKVTDPSVVEEKVASTCRHIMLGIGMPGLGKILQEDGVGRLEIRVSHALSEEPVEDRQLLFRLMSSLQGVLTNQLLSVDQDLRSYVSTVHGITSIL